MYTYGRLRSCSISTLAAFQAPLLFSTRAWSETLSLPPRFSSCGLGAHSPVWASRLAGARSSNPAIRCFMQPPTGGRLSLSDPPDPSDLFVIVIIDWPRVRPVHLRNVPIVVPELPLLRPQLVQGIR